MCSAARITSCVVGGDHFHFCVEVGQVEKTSGRCYGKTMGGIEREKVDAGLVVSGYVGAHVEFGELRCAGNRRQAAGVDVRHFERDDAQPGMTVECVYLQS